MVTNKVRIFVIAPYPGLENVFRALAPLREDAEIHTALGNMSTWQQALESLPPSEYDVIISRGGTARVLKEVQDKPVVEIPVSMYDIFATLQSAEEFSGRYVVVGHENITSAAASVSGLMKRELSVHPVNSRSNLKKELLELKAEGYGLFLCDLICLRNARELGLSAMLITSGERSAIEALDDAVQLVRCQGSLLRENRIYRSLLGTSRYPLAALDEEGRLIFGSGEEKERRSLATAISAQIDRTRSLPFTAELLWEGRLWEISAEALPLPGEHITLFRLQPGKRAQISADPHTPWQELKESDQIIDDYFAGSLRGVLEDYARSPFPVLIEGEDGTGKDTAARTLYKMGPREYRQFCEIDCRGLTDEKARRRLLESERSPLLQSGMVVYLRDIDALDHEQASLLFEYLDTTRILSRNRLFFSVGNLPSGNEECAAARMLKNKMAPMVLRLPPLRERRKDIPDLLALLLGRQNIQLGRQVVGYTPAARRRLMEYNWPGNLVQMNRLVRTLAALTESPFIEEPAVQRMLEEENRFYAPKQERLTVDLNLTLPEMMRQAAAMVLEEERGNRSRAAARLGITRATLYKYVPDEKGR